MRAVLFFLVWCALAASTTAAVASDLEPDPIFGVDGVMFLGDLDPGSRIAFTVDPSGRILSRFPVLG